jgi:transglutaminase-like putative cysteine protease
MTARRTLRVGCEFVYLAEVPTPAVTQVVPDETGPAQVLTASWHTDPELSRTTYTDLYGNTCQRSVLPAGRSTVRYDAQVSVPDATEDVDLEAAETPVAELPDEALIYTMPSRYVVPDLLGDEAWKLFGSLPPGYRRVQAICDHVHDSLRFAYGSSTPRTTAAEVADAGVGVCRDFAHLALSYTRALNIPAHGRRAGSGADGLRRLDGGLPRWHVVDLRPSQQHPAQGPRRDRSRPGRTRRRDGDDVRRPVPRADGCLGRGGHLVTHNWERR